MCVHDDKMNFFITTTAFAIVTMMTLIKAV